MPTIEVIDVGPVSKVSIPCPDEGGLVVLRGYHGVGKSKTLEAIDYALTGRGKVEKRDGQLSGSITGLGVTVNIRKSAVRRGEAEVELLDGRLSIVELINPGLKDPEAADAKRIKALISLAGVAPSAELFWPLVGGQANLEAIVNPKTLAADDLVTMAARVKADLEAASRKETSQAEIASGRAIAARQAAQGVDLEQEADASQLQKTLELAIQRKAELETRAKSTADAIDAAEDARQQLGEAESGYEGLSLQEATAQEADAVRDYENSQEQVRLAEAALKDARAASDTYRHKYNAALVARKNAEAHERTIAQWKDQIESGIPDGPSDDELHEAGAAVMRARQAVETGALIRKARSDLEAAEKAAEDATSHRNKADALRDAAKATDDILSGCVSKCCPRLRVLDGRLVFDMTRGITYLADLSDGDRTDIALDVAIAAVGEGGVFTLPQTFYEGLAPSRRKQIAEKLRECGVVAFTAEVSDEGEISAEVYS